MASGILVSVDEYLHTSYSPDCDYVDGVVMERNLGERDHSRLQGLLVGLFFVNRKKWGIHVYPEQRIQVKPTRFRVPDLCVLAGAEPQEQIFTVPPLVCIEILSSEDRWSRVQERIDDYLLFGVPYVWVIDPRTRKAFEFTPAGMHEVKEFTIETPPIHIPLSALFDD
jgi:Uma2 family endonuclease